MGSEMCIRDRVKVQYPEVKRHFAGDFQGILNTLRIFKPGEVAAHEHFREIIHAELNFEREAATMVHIAEGIQRHFPRSVGVPRPIPGMISSNVLTMTWLDGTPLLTTLERLAALAAERIGCTVEQLQEEVWSRLTAAADSVSQGTGQSTPPFSSPSMPPLQ